MKLDGAVCVVTGAARGLGKAISEVLASKGAAVALVDILEDELMSSASELAEMGYRVLAVPTDITAPQAVEAMAHRVERELGVPQVLINNAGTFSVIGPVWEADPKKWLTDVQVNLCGTFLCSRAIVARMVARRCGHVVNIASSGGVSDAHPYSTSYASSKTAILRLTEGLAEEGEQHGIRAFAIGPPAIRTKMTEFIAADPDGRRWRPGFESSNWHSTDCLTDAILTILSGDFDRLTGRFIPLPMNRAELVAQIDRILAEDLLTLRVRYLSRRD
jgi:NAD(P)-dependent dehydrogenase (short-subunit alcohol dehydrogenase family)